LGDETPQLILPLIFTDAMPPANDFLTTFTERQKCFADLLELSKRQLGLVEDDDYTELLGLLGGKQQIIGRLEALGRARPGLWDDWRSQREHLAPAARNACDETLTQTEALLARLLEHERSSTEALARRRDQTARELRTLAAGSRVNQAYRDSLAPVTHRHLDMDQ
jgi:hypothetical protein